MASSTTAWRADLADGFDPVAGQQLFNISLRQGALHLL
eukprot:CAMPEP_0176279506 /NCGR_PEP_ID=MMETSP0121_2-20121125/49319_1 /TAXON_ID=160619 /ORGANISM="Kryptoperidinium foliaceum, Strain CCMP 1326" /LENGTH=37 /DNA_ID= /DNA_START= /DNA_END= /DNA_ORIENTATION=